MRPQEFRQYKLFDYLCPKCSDKRQIQYFYSGGTFLPQKPVATCGACQETSVPTEIFKTADFQCPQCSNVRKVRLMAKPASLTSYESAVVTCDKCWWRGQAALGQHMASICEVCFGESSRLADVWAENGQTLTAHCRHCDRTTQSVVLPHGMLNDAIQDEKEGNLEGALMFECPQCSTRRNLRVEDVTASKGLTRCWKCGWRGVPADLAQMKPGELEEAARPALPLAQPASLSVVLTAL